MFIEHLGLCLGTAAIGVTGVLGVIIVLSLQAPSLPVTMANVCALKHRCNDLSWYNFANEVGVVKRVGIDHKLFNGQVDNDVACCLSLHLFLKDNLFACGTTFCAITIVLDVVIEV